MKVNKYLIVIFSILIGLSYNSTAQNKEPEPLDSILIYLENRFDVVFSFADANVQNVTVALPNKEMSLDELLLELERQTDLDFHKVNARYIAIRKIDHAVWINGIIVDKSSWDRLEGAVIYSGKTHALSNKNGFFSMVVNRDEDSVLVIRHVGYKPLRKKLESLDSDTVLFEMEVDILELEEVKLHYISMAIEKLDNGSIQLNTQNLEVLPGLSEPDVLQVIQVLPGIQSINETISDINTRGGTNDQTLVLWDGVKMYQSGHFFGLISAFNSQLIQKSLIIKNGTHAAYDEGISGTIDMHLQDYMVQEFEVNAGLNMLSADFITKIPVGSKLSLILSARHSINDLVETPTYKSYYRRAFEHTEVMLTQGGADTIVDTYQDFSFYDMSAKVLYDITEKDKLRFSLLGNKNTIEYKETANIRDTLFIRESHLMQSNLLSNLAYTRLWSENQETEFSAYISNYLLDGSNISLADNQNHLQENEVLDWGLRVESKNQIDPNVQLFSGYHFKEIGIRNLDNIQKPNYKRDVKDVLRIHSLYAEAELTDLFDRLYVRAGLRTNYFSKFDQFSFEPRIALNFSLNRYISLEALAEKKSQHTTQLIDFQTDFLGVEKRRWVLSNNESVPLLKSQQFSLGLQYNRNNFLISLEAYLKKVRGIITPSQGFQNQYQFIYSIGEYEAQGMELLLNKRFKRSTTWLTYTLAKNDYYFAEFIPSVFPNNLDIRHAVSVGGSINLQNFEVSAGFNYHTGKPYTQPAQEDLNEANEIIWEEANISRLKDYARLDLSAKYSFTVKDVNAELGVSFWNILNCQNIYNIFYQVNEKNEIEQIIQNTLGFTPNVGLRVRF